ncbi:MAG: site-2 protease family protein [Gammaproteobacteria bacterium]|nr:site-2 protease family protein [Gammaproteobacteria bacterium]
MQFDLAQKIMAWLIPLIFAITVHEVAHGWVASLLGDKTAQRLGRLTLNPIKHIDIMGTLIVPILLLLVSGGRFAFGWAKPVPVDWRNLRSPRLGMALVAISGPVANILMALIWAGVAKFSLSLQVSEPWTAFILMNMGMSGIVINIVFGVLNLIPIPPLDGSRVLSAFLSPKASLRYNSLERYGFLILILLMVTNILSSIIYPPVQIIAGLIIHAFGIG